MAYASGMPLTSSPSYMMARQRAQEKPQPGGEPQNKPAPIPGESFQPSDRLRLATQRVPMTAEQINKRAEALISGNTSWGNLDEEQLGKDLAGARKTPELINGVFDKLGDSDRDDVGYEFTRQMSDAQLKEMASSSQGRKTLQRISNDLNSGSVYDEETAQVQRIGKAMAQKHARLLDETMPTSVQKVMNDNNLKQQKLSTGNGAVNFDEYSVTIDKMPPGVTPEKFLQDFAKDPNGTVKDSGFDTWAEFHRRNPEQSVKPGTIYDIDMKGPDNGTVIVRDVSDHNLTVSTVECDKYGTHPIYGNREFGFHKNKDGSTTFYTRAADRYDGLIGNTRYLGSGVGVSTVQNWLWNDFTRGVANQIEKQGGTVRPNSRTEYHEMQ